MYAPLSNEKCPVSSFHHFNSALKPVLSKSLSHNTAECDWLVKIAEVLLK